MQPPTAPPEGASQANSTIDDLVGNSPTQSAQPAPSRYATAHTTVDDPRLFSPAAPTQASTADNPTSTATSTSHAAPQSMGADARAATALALPTPPLAGQPPQVGRALAAWRDKVYELLVQQKVSERALAASKQRWEETVAQEQKQRREAETARDKALKQAAQASERAVRGSECVFTV